MPGPYPHPRTEGVVSVGVGILLSLITCGIYSIFWQYRQMETVNAWLGRKELDFWVWFFLSIVTCGIFAIYYEYKMAKAINEVQETRGFRVNSDLPLLSILLTVFGIWIASIAVQQADINNFYGTNPDL